jgi:hypothetical protein
MPVGSTPPPPSNQINWSWWWLYSSSTAHCIISRAWATSCLGLFRETIEAAAATMFHPPRESVVIFVYKC